MNLRLSVKLRKLLLFTSSAGKIREIKMILTDLPCRFVTIRNLKIDLSALPEEGGTYAENALMKARFGARASGLLTLAEDTGLEVDFLNGGPGVKSKRFKKGSDKGRVEKLLSLLKGIPKDKRKARFVSYLAVVDPQSGGECLFKGEAKGLIAFKPSGKEGFGYDSIFVNPSLKTTFANVSIKYKNTVSHRAHALKKAFTYLKLCCQV